MSISSSLCLVTALLMSTSRLCSQVPRELHAAEAFDTVITPNLAHDYYLRLSTGESADLVVQQNGVDLVVETRDPNGSVSTFDSPNGRNGPEPVEIVANASGIYAIRVRPFDGREPAGNYSLRVLAMRSAGETTALLRSRQLARDSATKWLSLRSASIPSNAIVPIDGPVAPIDTLAMRARVLGIGEATHGSREFGDLRLSLTRRLIERNGYRVVAIEASAARLGILNMYVSGALQPGPLVTRALESGWIGRRAQRELLPWLRQWNAKHPNDRVELVGVDPEENFIAGDSLVSFLTRAYGSDVMARLAPMFAEFAAADSQTLVFANSDVDSTARRSILELIARLDLDAGILARRFGLAALEQARSTARQLAQFAEFNSSRAGLINRSRDYYMAANLLEAINRRGSTAKAVFWAHNAHVAHPRNQSVTARTSGGWLREWFGCDYAAIGVSFGEGSFVAQLPNDLTDRLAISRLPNSPPQSIDAVLAGLRNNASIVSWPCSVDKLSLPSWLTTAQPMHWVGALWAPGSSPSDAFRSYDLLRDFDGVVFIPRVTADEMPTDRPLVPARKK